MDALSPTGLVAVYVFVVCSNLFPALALIVWELRRKRLAQLRWGWKVAIIIFYVAVGIAAATLFLAGGGESSLGLLIYLGMLGIPLGVLIATRSASQPVTGLCLRCGYDVRGIASGICPECGTAIASSPEAKRSS